LKVHKKDGVITAIETDNTIHANAGREDAYVDFDEFRQGMYQHRACTRGRGWRQDVYSPRRSNTQCCSVGPRGSRQFKRISWDEALDLLAKKYLEVPARNMVRIASGEMVCWAQAMTPSVPISLVVVLADGRLTRLSRMILRIHSPSAMR
jgi:anaerobic selenocysteine-containing dehydrogenase